MLHILRIIPYLDTKSCLNVVTALKLVIAPCSFFTIENRFFSHPIHPYHSFPSLHPSQFSSSFYPPLSPDSPLPFPFKKEQASKKQQQNTTKQDTRKQSKILFIEAQGSPTGRKVSQEQVKDSETHPVPQLGVR